MPWDFAGGQPFPFPWVQPSMVGPRSQAVQGAEMPFNLGCPPELGPDMDHFLQELASSAREDSRNDSSP